jgi:hypothetical protein
MLTPVVSLPVPEVVGTEKNGSDQFFKLGGTPSVSFQEGTGYNLGLSHSCTLL